MNEQPPKTPKKVDSAGKKEANKHKHDWESIGSIENEIKGLDSLLSNTKRVKELPSGEFERLSEKRDELKRKRDSLREYDEYFNTEPTPYMDKNIDIKKPTTPKIGDELKIPKGVENLTGEKAEIGPSKNINADPDFLSHTAQWTHGVETPEKKDTEEAPEFYKDFLNEKEEKKVKSTSQVISEAYPQLDRQQDTNTREEEVLPPVILHEEPQQVGNQSTINSERRLHVTIDNTAEVPQATTTEEQPPQQNPTTQPTDRFTINAIRNIAPNTPAVERGERKEYTPDQARKVLDILCGNGDFSLVPYNASAEDRALLGDIIKKDWKMVSPADRERMIPVIERTFTQRVVDKALELHEIKDAREAVRTEVLNHSKEKGLSYEDAMQVMKSKLREGDRKYAQLEQSNRFEPTLIELKKLMLKDKAAALEEEFRGKGYNDEQINALLVEKLVTGEKIRIADKKTGEYKEVNESNSYEQLLLKMVFREQQADQRKIEEIYEAEQMKHPGVFKKAMTQLSKIPRPWRSAIIGASLAGGGLAIGLGAGTAAAMSLPVYLGYRAIRSATGGTFGYFLQKWVGEKVVDAAYTSDIRKAYEQTVETGANIMSESEQLKQMVLERDFDSFAEKNYKYGKVLDEEFRKKEAVANRYRKWNRGLMTVVTGIVGGNLGSQLIDAGTNFAVGAVAATGAAENFTDTPKEGINPETPPIKAGDLAVAHKGDSVWTLIDENATKVKGFNDLNEAQRTYFIDHLKDQVAADPHKFGLENADQIKIGYGKELGQLFENNQDIQQTLESAKHLTKGQMDSIMHSNASQRAALFESMKPKVSGETLTENASTSKNSIVGEEDWKDTSSEKIANVTFSVKGVDAYGVETTKELPIALKGNNELAQSYLNYKGNPNFVDGSQTQEWAQQNGAESLVKLTEQHPEYLKIAEVRDALREIHTNNLVEELHEGGAFKFLNSADHADLLHEVKGLAKTYGFDSYRADSFADYVSQGSEMNEETFTPFIDNTTGSFLSDKFYESVSHFNELAKSVTPPEIPEGATSSIWEPRLIAEPNSDPVIGLVRQSSPGIFEYKLPTGHIGSGLNERTISEMIVKPPSTSK